MTKRQANQLDKQIEAIYQAHCKGIQIPIMRIGEIFAAGRRAAADGLDITAAVVACVAGMAVRS